MDIVWVNGCFDVLHLGHIELLKYARSLGDYLYVGLDSDARVKQSKGESRPYNNEMSRYSVMQSIKYVDNVTLFDSEYQLREYIRMANPLYMVVGSDYRGKKVVGSEFAEVIYFERIPNYSSTSILEKM